MVPDPSKVQIGTFILWILGAAALAIFLAYMSQIGIYLARTRLYKKEGTDRRTSTPQPTVNPLICAPFRAHKEQADKNFDNIFNHQVPRIEANERTIAVLVNKVDNVVEGVNEIKAILRNGYDKH